MADVNTAEAAHSTLTVGGGATAPDVDTLMAVAAARALASGVPVGRPPAAERQAEAEMNEETLGAAEVEEAVKAEQEDAEEQAEEESAAEEEGRDTSEAQSAGEVAERHGNDSGDGLCQEAMDGDRPP